MIKPVIHDAIIRPAPDCKGWLVRHPSNDAILAYCDTREEAVHYRDALNDLPRQLREVGREVKL